jgi:4-amino-4-deoxy-L-arabinose transferase-like glycosyltransferase
MTSDPENPAAPEPQDPKTAPEEALVATSAPVEPLPEGAAVAAEGDTANESDESESDAPSAAAAQSSEAHPWLLPALAALLPLAFFFILPPLTKSGLWDPYELNVADLARRVALNLFGADSLSLLGADNSLPHLNDLGRPQLPFTSIALGFKIFGLHEWAGRAPLALWGFAGVMATYAWLSRLVDKRAGLYAAVALTTMPLYFVQARTMLGDIVTMAAFSMSFGGLAVAVFDRDSVGPTRVSARIPWLAMAVIGLVAGFESRGGAIGLGVPMIGVGLAWGLSRVSGEEMQNTLSDVVGALSLALGLGAVVLAWIALNPDVQSSSKLLPIVSLGQVKASDLNYWIGAAVKTQAKYPTADFYIGHLGPALAPWSAFAPWAIGRMFIAPVGRVGYLQQRESFTRLLLLVGISVALVLHAFLAIKTDLIAFCAPAAVAAACAIAIRDYERGAHPSLAVGVGAVVFVGLFHHDFHELPEKAYQAYAIAGATFPDSFKDHALELWTVALVLFAGFAFLTWIERDPRREPFDPKGYARVLKALREAYDGLLVLSFFALVAGASIAGVILWTGSRFHARWLPTISLQIRDGVMNAWWVTAFVPIIVIFGFYYGCDIWLWAFGRSKPFSTASLTRGFEPFEALYATLRAPTRPRESEKSEKSDDEGVKAYGDKDERKGKDTASDLLSEDERLTGLFILAPLMLFTIPVLVAGPLYILGVRPLIAAALAIPSGVVAFLYLGAIGDLLKGSRAAFFILNSGVIGFVLCFSYYPALANQLSPKEVFESYEKRHKDSEPLALFGVGGRTAAYYAGGQPTQLNDTPAAYAWLMGGQGGRRFMAMKAEELPKLNQLYRERVEPRHNLPIIDGRSSQIILASSTLGDDKSENPLDKMILTELPHPQHKLEVNMEDKLEVLGYDLIDNDGHFVDSIAPGRKYRMRTYYRVLAPVTTEWEAFTHIDGFHRRHNGDHKPLDGKYPFALWLKGDLIVDDYQDSLEPNFSPGPYTLYFGLFVGETRLKVKSGPSDGDNRIDGGTIRVQ